MATISWGQVAEAPVRDSRWLLVLRVAVSAATLAGSPVLAREAVAQRSASVQATAYVTDSYLGARLRADTVSAAPRPSIRRVRLEGLGVLDVQTGPGIEIRVGTRVEDPRRGAAVIQIAYVST